MHLILKSMRTLSPILLCSAAFATSFSGGPSGPSFGSNCSVAVSASLLGGGVNSTANGMSSGGSALNVNAALNLSGFSGCGMTWTSTRQMNDAAGSYDMSSSISGSQLAGVDVGILGGATLSVETFLNSQPGIVATATYNFPLLALLTNINISSGPVSVNTTGNDTLTQVVRLQFGGTPLLLGLNASLLSQPSFASDIVAAGASNPVPEPGTTLLAGIGLGLLTLSRVRMRKPE